VACEGLAGQTGFLLAAITVAFTLWQAVIRTAGVSHPPVLDDV
jgi:hypothetical protein